MDSNLKSLYISHLNIKKVRHLKDIEIPFCSQDKNEMKHLLITGKNGSGKTSVLEALANHLSDVCGQNQLGQAEKSLKADKQNLTVLFGKTGQQDQVRNVQERIDYWNDLIEKFDFGIRAEFTCDSFNLREEYQKGHFILAYFKTDRVFKAMEPKHVEKVVLKDCYGITEEPRKDFIKYLVDKKVSQSLFQTKNEPEKAEKLNQWFLEFEKLLRNIFEDDKLQLDFDVDTFTFHILEKGRERFDFNTMSSGYAAILDIVVGIIMRMEQHTGGVFRFDMPGIVLIDELETHLHYELQKKVLPFLTTVFPNIQFIVSTHSAFILSSIGNTVIYDLENRVLVRDGLTDIPYEGVIEGYFDVTTLSKELQNNFEKFKKLVKKETVSDEDLAELKRLEIYLEEIPDYLALDVVTEYRRLKLEFESREDLNGKS